MKGSPARVEGVVAPVEVGRWRGRRVRKGSARAAHAPHAVGSEGDRPHLLFAGGPLVGGSGARAGVLGTTANRLVHASPRLRRGLPAQAMLRVALGKGAGHRFARLRRALAAS